MARQKPFSDPQTNPSNFGGVMDSVVNDTKKKDSNDPYYNPLDVKFDQELDLNNIDYNNPLDLLTWMKSRFGADGDTKRDWYQLLLQYIINEQNYYRNHNYSELNYDRSKAANQVALMMQAGMSRSAALAALQGGSSPASMQTDSNITPIQTQGEANKRANLQNILDIVETSSKLAGQIAALASVPFDIKAKSITNTLLNNQANMLDMQVQGLQDAAMFMQAVANADQTRPEGQKLIDMSVSDQYDYFNQQAKLRPIDKGFVASAHMYGNGEYYRRAASNPFFWSAVNETVSKRNQANASIFDPKKAEESVASIRAGINYTNTLKDVESVRKRIFNTQAFHDEMMQNLRLELAQLEAQCQKYHLTFDKKRALKFIELVDKFNLETSMNLDGNIERMTYLHNAEVYQATQAELLASSDYNVGAYVYGSALNSLKNGVLSAMYELGNDGVTVYPNDELNKWINNYLKYTELGGATALNAKLQVPRTIFSGINTAGLIAYGGFKIYSGLDKLKGAAGTAGYTFSSSNSLTLPSFAPLVTPTFNQSTYLSDPLLRGIPAIPSVQ